MEKITIKNPSFLTAAPGCVALSEGVECEVKSYADVSDGFHTIQELYDHRIELYITLCRLFANKYKLQWDGNGIWRSKLHSDGTSYDGWFILGILTVPGQQISYHIPLKRWDDTSFASTLDVAPEFDGHTSQDVLTRLKTL